MLLKRMMRRPTWASAMRWRRAGSRAAPLALAILTTSSNSFWNSICWPRVDTPRSKPSRPMATFQPSPGAPTMSSAAQTASSKNTSLNSLVPVSCSIGRTVTPGWSIASRKKPRPLWATESGSVRAITNTYWDSWASEVHTFWPLMSHWLPDSSSRAFVFTLARSEPAEGSEYPWHQNSLPARMPGR